MARVERRLGVGRVLLYHTLFYSEQQSIWCSVDLPMKPPGRNAGSFHTAKAQRAVSAAKFDTGNELNFA